MTDHEAKRLAVALINYSLNDINHTFDGLTDSERAIVGDEAAFQGLLEWLKKNEPGGNKAHSLESYVAGANLLTSGLDVHAAEEGQNLDGSPGGQYVLLRMWVQDNWINSDGTLTDEGQKFCLALVNNPQLKLV